MTKWWSRQPDPYDVDPIWQGPFDSEADALASLSIAPGEIWGGSVYEASDDFDPWASESVSAPAKQTVPQEWSTAIEVLARVDDFPFLSEGYMGQTRVALAAFQAAAKSLAAVDHELAATAEKAASDLELFLAQSWPDDPSEVETRDIASDREDGGGAANSAGGQALHERTDDADTTARSDEA